MAASVEEDGGASPITTAGTCCASMRNKKRLRYGILMLIAITVVVAVVVPLKNAGAKRSKAGNQTSPSPVPAPSPPAPQEIAARQKGADKASPVSSGGAVADHTTPAASAATASEEQMHTGGPNAGNTDQGADDLAAAAASLGGDTHAVTAQPPAAGSSSASTSGGKYVDTSSLITAQGSKVCVARTGPELIGQLSEASPCTLITLLPGATYDMGTEETVITSVKVVVGSPVPPPLLEGGRAPRVFRIRSGGSLDLRWMRVHRGQGEIVTQPITGRRIPLLRPMLDLRGRRGGSCMGDDGCYLFTSLLLACTACTLALTRTNQIKYTRQRGGTAYVELGGRFTATGVLFTFTPPPLDFRILPLSANPQPIPRIMGGQIFMVGGFLTLNLCQFVVITEGTLFGDGNVMGGDILIYGGLAVFNGCIFTHWELFSSIIGVAVNVAVLGGVVVQSGCTYLDTVALACTLVTAGTQLFVGGGVVIATGCNFAGHVGMLAFVGAGVAVFNGGGVVVLVGCTLEFALGITAQVAAGIVVGMGAGTLTMVGCVQTLNVGIGFNRAAGVFHWVGAGTQVLVGVPQDRQAAVLDINTFGVAAGVGAGVLVSIDSPNSDHYGVLSIVAAGGNYAVGAGLLIEIACPFIKSAGVLFAVVWGIDAFVGTGAAVISRSPGYVATGVSWFNPGATVYYVGGPFTTNLTSFFASDGSASPLTDGDDDRNNVAGEKKYGDPDGDRSRRGRRRRGKRGLWEKSGGVRRGARRKTAAGQQPSHSSLTILDGQNYQTGEEIPIDDPLFTSLRDKLEALSAHMGGGGGGGGDAKSTYKPLRMKYATVNNGEGGDATCNTCGFRGDVADEIVGTAADVCMADSQKSQGSQCSLADVVYTGKDGSAKRLSSWQQTLASLFDPTTNKATLPDTAMVTGKLRVGCNGDQAAEATRTHCVSMQDAQSVVEDSLGTDCARVNVSPRGATSVKELKDVSPVDGSESLAASTYTDVFDLVLTTHDRHCTEAVTAWVKDVHGASMVSEFNHAAFKGRTIGEAEVEYVTTHEARGLDIASAQAGVTKALISTMSLGLLPAVLIHGPANQLAMPTLDKGSEARVSISGFKAGQSVVLRLTKRCLPMALDNAGEQAEDQLTTVEFEGGVVSVPIVIPEQAEPGVYAIRATQNGLGWCSQPFRIEGDEEDTGV